MMHNGHPRFHELLEKMRELHAAKNADYAGSGDPLRNLRRCADAGIEPWKGVIVRLSDKYDRLLTFAEKGSYAVKDESVIDTFLDTAIYSLLGIVLYEDSVARSEHEVRTLVNHETRAFASGEWPRS